MARTENTKDELEKPRRYSKKPEDLLEKRAEQLKKKKEQLETAKRRVKAIEDEISDIKAKIAADKAQIEQNAAMELMRRYSEKAGGGFNAKDVPGILDFLEEHGYFTVSAGEDELLPEFDDGPDEAEPGRETRGAGQMAPGEGGYR